MVFFFNLGLFLQDLILEDLILQGLFLRGPLFLLQLHLSKNLPSFHIAQLLLLNQLPHLGTFSDHLHIRVVVNVLGVVTFIGSGVIPISCLLIDSWPFLRVALNLTLQHFLVNFRDDSLLS